MAMTFGFWMILRGCPCMWNCVRPIGKQSASGLSLEFKAFRCFLSSAAQVVNGRPPGILAPSSKKVAIGGEFGSVGGAG
jgi:hypothetical protein